MHLEAVDVRDFLLETEPAILLVSLRESVISLPNTDSSLQIDSSKGRICLALISDLIDARRDLCLRKSSLKLSNCNITYSACSITPGLICVSVKVTNSWSICVYHNIFKFSIFLNYFLHTSFTQVINLVLKHF